MNKIASFDIDHTTLQPGIYIRDIKSNIVTFDIRIFKPNTKKMSNKASHSLEHLLAVFFQGYAKEDKIGVFPMGCLTGFYILIKGKQHDVNWMKQALFNFNNYLISCKSIPGTSIKQCGSYKLHSLKKAQKTFNNFIKLINNHDKQ